jgi:hypothetical protein
VERVNPDTKQKEIVQIPFNGNKYSQYTFGLKIDVGASTQWSEITSINTLDGWIDRKLITFKQYLERLPKNIVADTEGLIDEIEQQENGTKIQEYEAMAQIIEQFVPPELQQQAMAIIQQTSQGGMQNGMQTV